MTDTKLSHNFLGGESVRLVFHNDSYKIYHPTAASKRKGIVEAKRQSATNVHYRYLRSSGKDNIAMQEEAFKWLDTYLKR